jgi:hypothetical protein
MSTLWLLFTITAEFSRFFKFLPVRKTLYKQY